MEKRKILVGDQVETITVKKEGNQLVIGDMPQLCVDLENQKNYIVVDGKKVPYRKEVTLSADLLSGKRKNVYATAVSYYYHQACKVAEGLRFAEAYRPLANKTVREIRD